MKTIKKRIVLLALLILVISLNSSVLAFSKKDNAIIAPNAWAGRPGGNNGIEEWTNPNLSYGQSSGSYILVSKSSGSVKKLNRARGLTSSAILWAVGIKAGSKPLAFGLTLADAIANAGIYFPGTKYTSYFYVSGRSGRIEFYFYNDSGKRVGKFVEYIKW